MIGHFSKLLGQYTYAGVTHRPGIYAFHSIMSTGMHICSNSSNIISNWHYAGAWSRILLVRTDSALRSHRSLTFRLVAILVLNVTHTLHRSFVTMFFLPLISSVSQLSHVTVRHSRSISVFNFWYVAYATFLFLGSGANASLKLWALFMLH